ncbi:hypothetical protein CLOM_g4483, partial [Closterium sp. NIES-68]
MPFGLKNASANDYPEKCHLGVKTVAYLGFQVGEGGLSVQQAKVGVVDRLKAPTDCSTLRAQLGFLSYYRRFIPNFSKTAKPLNQLLRKDEGWKWWKEQERAWTTLKEAVKTVPLLKLPSLSCCTQTGAAEFEFDVKHRPGKDFAACGWPNSPEARGRREERDGSAAAGDRRWVADSATARGKGGPDRESTYTVGALCRGTDRTDAADHVLVGGPEKRSEGSAGQ